MTRYPIIISNLDHLPSRLTFIETIWAIKIGNDFNPNTYETEDEAIDEAENILNETESKPDIKEVEVYKNGIGKLFFFEVD